MGLMDSLGMANVEADPNALPDGKWAGVIFKSEYVFVKKNESIAHTITYKVTEGDRAGAQRTEWFTLGTDPVYDDNGKLVSVTSTMSEAQKPWYKKRIVNDLGVDEQTFLTDFEPGSLVGKDVTFGTKKNGEYINISFVELRGTTGPSGSVSPVGTQTGSVSDLI